MARLRSAEPELPRLLTARELAEQFGSLSLPRIRRLTQQGVIPHIRLGRRSIRYSQRAIAEWLERGGSRPGSDD